MPTDSREALLRDARALLAYQGELGLVGVNADAAVLTRRPPATSHPAAPHPAASQPGRGPLHATLQTGAAESGPTPQAAGATGAAPLQAIRADLGDCSRCKLAPKRTHIVFGVGNPAARLMFVGEGPGRDEDLQGEPFVGAAGKLLDKMIAAMGLRRSDVYIANIVKCRPPRNRDPEPDEVAACEPFLRRQIAAVHPEVIVALGRCATQTLLRDKTSITRMRGRWREYEKTALMPTFHPAYLLRNPGGKRAVWEDLQAVMRRLDLPLPQRSKGH